MRVHGARGGVFLRSRTSGDGESDVSVWGDADDRTEADDEVFREAEESARCVLFSLWIGVGVVRVAVFWIISRGIRVRGAVQRLLSHGFDIFKESAGGGDVFVSSRGEARDGDDNRQGTAAACVAF